MSVMLPAAVSPNVCPLTPDEAGRLHDAARETKAGASLRSKLLQVKNGDDVELTLDEAAELNDALRKVSGPVSRAMNELGRGLLMLLHVIAV